MLLKRFFGEGFHVWLVGSQLIRHEVSRNLAVSDSGEQVVESVMRHFIRYFKEIVGLEYLCRAELVLPKVLFKKFLAQENASPPFFGLEPRFDPRPSLGSLGELE